MSPNTGRLQKLPLSSKPPGQRGGTCSQWKHIVLETKEAGLRSGLFYPDLSSSVLRTEGTGVSRLVAKAAFPGLLGCGPRV